MKELIERFYNSIREGTPLPIPYREIILTARIMDEIFAQIYGGQARKPLLPMNREPVDTNVNDSLRVRSTIH